MSWPEVTVQLGWVHLHPKNCFVSEFHFGSLYLFPLFSLKLPSCLYKYALIKLKIKIRITVEKFYFTQKLSSVKLKVIMCSLHLTINIAVGHISKKLTSTVLESVNSLLCAFFTLCRGVTGCGVYPVWQANWSRRSYQGLEWPEASRCHRAHHCKVCKQSKPKNQSGHSFPAVPFSKQKVSRPSSSAGSTF